MNKLYIFIFIFMRSIKYLANVYTSVSYFFMGSIKYCVNVYTSVSFFFYEEHKTQVFLHPLPLIC